MTVHAYTVRRIRLLVVVSTNPTFVSDMSITGVGCYVLNFYLSYVVEVCIEIESNTVRYFQNKNKLASCDSSSSLVGK